MRAKQCSINDLSSRTGLSTSKISRIRTGRGCKMVELEAIAKALNKDAADFFKDTQSDSRNSDVMNLLDVVNGMAQRRDPETTTIGASVRRERKNRDMTQSDLAEKIGVTQATISEIETEDRDATTDILWAISRVLRVPVESLLPPPKHPVTGDFWAARRFVLALAEQVRNLLMD